MALVVISAIIFFALVCGITMDFLIRRFLIIDPQKRIHYARGKL